MKSRDKGKRFRWRVASWLVSSPPDRAIWVRALAGDIVLCSWARHPLNSCALKYQLFQKNCCPPPACPLCDAPVEDPKNYFPYCFAALREKLFASAAQLLGLIDGIVLPIRKKIDGFLNSISHDDFDTNVNSYVSSTCPVIYFLVQPFLLVNFYSFVYVLFDRHV